MAHSIQEVVYLLYLLLLIYYKGYNLGIVKWKRCIGKGMEERYGGCTELPWLLWEHYLHSQCIPYLDVFSILKALWALPLRGFYGGSITQQWLTTSLAISVWTLSLALLRFPEVRIKVGMKGLIPMLRLFLWQPVLILKLCRVSPGITLLA